MIHSPRPRGLRSSSSTPSTCIFQEQARAIAPVRLSETNNATCDPPHSNTPNKLSTQNNLPIAYSDTPNSSPTMLLTNKEVVAKFYTRAKGSMTTYVCLCGTRRSQRGSGFSNLMQHLDQQHKHELRTLRNKQVLRTNNIMSSLLYTQKVRDIYGWMALVVDCLQPFSIVEKPTFKEHIKYGPISLKTFKNYLSLLTRKTESNIAALLPDRIAIVFDGHTTPDAHYVGVFATFPSQNAHGFEVVCLALSPMEDETRQTADEHISFLSYVLGNFGKSFENVIALVGDNCATNQSIGTKLKKPLIGCVSHRFQLSVREVIAEDEDAVKCVHSLMVKLRTPLLRAKLYEHTHLRAKLSNDTRWTSIYEMLRRHVALREHVSKLDDIDLDDLLLPASSERRIDGLVEKLKELNEVVLKLQTHNCTLRQARAYLDSVLDVYPTLDARLNPDARIVHSPVFESAVLKIQDKREEELTTSEKRVVKSLRIDVDDIVTSSNGTEFGDESIVERAMKRLRTTATLQKSNYLDTRFLVPTSNLCERLFSISGYALTNRRRGILPHNFESQIFLHVNHGFWSIEDIKQIVCDGGDTSSTEVTSVSSE